MANNKTDILQALNPADSFTLAMDEEIRKEGMPGSLCGFALELSETPNVTELAKSIEAFIEFFPTAKASLQQRGKRFYWCKRDEPRKIFFQHTCPKKINQVTFHQQTIEAIFNQFESREEQSPIEFHLINGINKPIFLLRWLHPFCDAKGAELILKFLITEISERDRLFTAETGKSLVNQKLDKYKWWQKIALFIKAKRYIESIDQWQSIIPFAHKPTEQPVKKLRYSIHRLTEQQTLRISKNARKQAGLTGTSLYYLGCLMRALDRINPDFQGDAYCVPYAFNLRKNKALNPVLGNHVCALFSQATKAQVQDRTGLFLHLKQQNTQVIREKLDYAFLPLMWAGSWLSLEKYGKTLRQSYRTETERSSFWFSDIGQPTMFGDTFFNTKIEGLFHLCQLSTPPALALLSCQYQGRLSLTYNYLEPYISEQWLNQLHDYMLEELLTE